MPEYLTPAEVSYLKEETVRIATTPDWRRKLDRRWETSTEFREAVQSLEVLSGTPLTRDGFARLIEIAWKIQNLNPIVMPQLLGTYTYYRYFKGFEGTEQDFAEHMAAKRPGWEKGSIGYEGADPIQVGVDVAALLTAPERELGQALHRLERHHGFGRALATGMLMLWQPKSYPIVNNASIGPFKRKGGPLYLTADRRARIRDSARSRYGLPDGAKYVRTAGIVGWMHLLSGLRDVCGFEDFFQLDLLLWDFEETAKGVVPRDPNRAGVTLSSRGATSVEDLIEQGLARLSDERLAAREKAIEQARALIEKRLGNIGEEELREMLRLFNSDFNQGTARADRFSPAFAGHTANQIVNRPEQANQWLEAIWRAQGDREVSKVLDQFWTTNDLPGAGRSFPTMVLHVRDPERFPPLSVGLARGYARLVGGEVLRKRTGANYLRYARGVAELREAHGIPAHGVDVVLMAGARAEANAQSNGTVPPPTGERSFRGFTAESFTFLRELSANNSDEWVAAHRTAFGSAVREPMRALISDLGLLFVRPVAPELEHAPKSPNTLASIRKNAFGATSGTYWPHYWAAFHRAHLKKTEDFQLYVYMTGDYLDWGMATRSASVADRARFAERLRKHENLAQRAWDMASAAGVTVRPEGGEDLEHTLDIPTVAALAAEVAKRGVVISRNVTARDAVLRGAAIADDVADTMRALYPLYALAIADDPAAELHRFWSGEAEDSTVDPDDVYGLEELMSETLFDEEFVGQIERLLAEKRQLVLYGPPGTGKTWFAERLARYLSREGGEVRLIQFHPSYGYEDFVEGIRPTLDDVTRQVQYAVEPGVFRSFCEEARRRPKQTFVLIIDEINRGNLPRIFGELLYLLDRRGPEHRVQLPVSRQQLWVPENLIIIGTMNTADQSIALVDVALRRRFHFVPLRPDSVLLRKWLSQNAPTMSRLADLIEQLNDALLQEGIDENLHIGHSHFMQAGIDELAVERIWNHSILPTLEEYLYGKPDRIARFGHEEFVEGRLLAADEVTDELEALEDAEEDVDGD